jgi:hypothetical protein
MRGLRIIQGRLNTSQNSIEMTIDDLIVNFENLPRTNAFVDKKLNLLFEDDFLRDV